MLIALSGMGVPVKDAAAQPSAAARCSAPPADPQTVPCAGHLDVEIPALSTWPLLFDLRWVDRTSVQGSRSDIRQEQLLDLEALRGLDGHNSHRIRRPSHLVLQGDGRNARGAKASMMPSA